MQKLFLVSVAFATIWISSPAAAMDTFISYRMYDSGLWEVDLINRGNDPLVVLSATANRSSSPACLLIPYAGLSGEWLARSDANEGKERDSVAWMNPIPAVRLERGQMVQAIVSRHCGYLLDIVFETDQGQASFEIK